jgi:transposase
MRGRPRKYSEEFCREAVRLVDAGTPLVQVARDLGIDKATLRSWRRRAGTAGASPATPAVGLALEEENRRLRRENERLREEREILKKATAFFAKGAR